MFRIFYDEFCVLGHVFITIFVYLQLLLQYSFIALLVIIYNAGQVTPMINIPVARVTWKTFCRPWKSGERQEGIVFFMRPSSSSVFSTASKNLSLPPLSLSLILQPGKINIKNIPGYLSNLPYFLPSFILNTNESVSYLNLKLKMKI